MKIDDILVSIIIPVYNVENYLKRCIDSVLNQTHRNIEIILIDDGSTDKSGKICDYYASIDSRIYVIHKENGGQSSARNEGLKIATGEYISFIDSDDLALPNMIQTLLLECLKQKCSISCINFIEFHEETTKHFNDTYDSADSITLSVKDSLLLLENARLKYNNVNISWCVWSKLYHKDVVKDIDFTTGIIYEDMLYNVKAICKAGSMAYTDKICYLYNIRDESTSHKRNIKTISNQMLKNWISERNKCITVLDSYGYYDIANLFKAKGYEVWLYYNALSGNTTNNSEIVDISDWVPKISDIKKLPLSTTQKIKLFLKIVFPKIYNFLVKFKMPR